MLQRKWGDVASEKNILPLPKEAKREAAAQKKQVKLEPKKPRKTIGTNAQKNTKLKNKRQSKNLTLP